MPLPVAIVTSGGLPVFLSTTGYGLPLEISTLPGALPVRVVTLGGIPCLDPMSNVFGPDITAPTITSANSGNNVENTVLAHALTANEAVTWSLNGGADVARFELSGSTLRWLANGTKDFENPDDVGANNTYVVTVRATDTALNTTDQTITITVTDVSGVAGELTAPVATWVSAASIAQATFDLDIDANVVAGDKVWGESSLNNFATVLETVSFAIGAPDLVDHEITDFAFSPFSDGLTYARFWISNSADVAISAKSNIISETILTASSSLAAMLLMRRSA